jgi:hypothetical protein
MMLLLIFYVAKHVIHIERIERKATVTHLPLETLEMSESPSHSRRGRRLDLLDEVGDRQPWWNGTDGVDVILDSIDSIRAPTCVFGGSPNDRIEKILDLLVDPGLSVLCGEDEVVANSCVRHFLGLLLS